MPNNQKGGNVFSLHRAGVESVLHVLSLVL